MNQTIFLEPSSKMPRQGSSSSGSPAKPTYAPPPKIWYSSSSTALQAPTLGQSVKQGFGMGVGMEAGRSLVGSLFGTSKPTQIQEPSLVPQTNPTYERCLEWNKQNPDVCKPFLSKDPSIWKQCMELNFFQASYCDQTY